jgi:hypothetical protein
LAAFALVFAGRGAIIANARYDDALGTVGIAFVFGLVIMAMVYATGHLSGAHINPAVTIAFAAARHFPSREAAAYIAAQLAGATLAALLLLAVWPDQPAELGTTVPSVGAGSALVYEVVLTAVLMFVITAVATDTRAVGAGAAIAIGGTVALGALLGGPVTGASIFCAIIRTRAGQRPLGRLLALHRRAHRWRRTGRVRLSTRTRRRHPRARAGGLVSGNASISRGPSPRHGGCRKDRASRSSSRVENSRLQEIGPRTSAGFCIVRD